MPLSSLTKTLNVFLQGLLASFMLAFLFQQTPSDRALDSFGKTGTGGAALLLVVGTAFCLLIGIAIDRFGERFVLPAIEYVAETNQHTLFFKLMRATAQLEAFLNFRERVVQHLELTVWRDERLNLVGYPGNRIFRSTVEAVVFNVARKEVLDWVVEHYSLCRLATGFAIILTMGGPVLFLQPIDLRLKIQIAIAWAAVLYGLLMTAVDQCLYSYTAMLGEMLARIPAKNPSYESTD